MGDPDADRMALALGKCEAYHVDEALLGSGTNGLAVTSTVDGDGTRWDSGRLGCGCYRSVCRRLRYPYTTAGYGRSPVEAHQDCEARLAAKILHLEASTDERKAGEW